ncbi:hypothetical protein CCY99_01020 [Helicobacter sp. 16-1353]|uniref:TetR/AcrR family transcriptional regulator n=1 Tax=Helicobacter sp. 16-1353 TaxID=2004996 RepID=UPI000DCDE3A7|nr:TetR/AcrR family transcriptional regulator [Helicobacter sp. 16-1353]RAX55313.1 hypothetical protein CCY99_01020 [Helicobacter sp. 16-1353]
MRKLDTFEHLSDEKKDRVVKALIKCFGLYGYTKTSVNDIAKEARISKASLFYYFETKENMYIYINDFVANELFKAEIPLESDLFQSLFNYMEAQVALSKKYPYIHYFINDQFKAKSPIISALQAKNDEKSTRKVLAKVKWEKLRDNIAKDEVIQIATLIFQGIISSDIEAKTIDEIYENIKAKLTILQKMVYKDEYL